MLYPSYTFNSWLQEAAFIVFSVLQSAISNVQPKFEISGQENIQTKNLNEFE